MYQREYEFAKNNILLTRTSDQNQIIIDNQLLHANRDQGLILHLGKLIEKNSQGEFIAIKSLSTAKVFSLSGEALDIIIQKNNATLEDGETRVIGDDLIASLFYYKRQSDDRMDKNLIDAMPYIVTDKYPALKAAQVNTQVEFDHAFRSVVQEPEYQGKRLLFISGLNVDISPTEGQIFPLIKFIPWATYYQDERGKHQTWEQAELYQRLKSQKAENPDKVDLEYAITKMESEHEIILPF